MAAQTALTLNTKAYNPRGKENSIAKWALVGDTTFGGATSQLTVSVGDPSKEGVSRVRVRLTAPKAASADSACACTGEVISTGLMDATFLVPSNYLGSERTDFRTRIKDFFSSAVFTAAIDNLEAPW